MALRIGELFIKFDFTVYRHFVCNNSHKSLHISLPFCDQRDILLPLTIFFLVSQGCQGPTSPCFQVTSTYCKGKGKAIPLQALTGPEDSRRLRLPDLKTIGT
jgi:hypothetical protein